MSIIIKILILIITNIVLNPFVRCLKYTFRLEKVPVYSLELIACVSNEIIRIFNKSQLQFSK